MKIPLSLFGKKKKNDQTLDLLNADESNRMIIFTPLSSSLYFNAMSMGCGPEDAVQSFSVVPSNRFCTCVWDIGVANHMKGVKKKSGGSKAESQN